MAIKTQGTRLYAIDPADDSLITVGKVTVIDGIDSSREQIEITDLDSLTDREYLSGLGAPGQASFTLNINPANPEHIRLYELKQSGETLKWCIGWSDGTAAPTVAVGGGSFTLPTTRSWLTFEGYLTSFPFSFALNAVVSTQVGIQISGAQTLTPKV